MSDASFQAWLEGQGYRVLQSPSGSWYEIAPRVLQAFPYHAIARIDAAERDALLRGHGCLALRYSTPLDVPHGQLSYHVVLDRDDFGLPRLAKTQRAATVKALQQFTVSRITFDELRTDGWTMREKTLVRQQRFGLETQSWWDDLCRAAEAAGFEAWGARCEGALTASLVAHIAGGCASIILQQSDTDFLSRGTNNALVYEFCRDAFARPDVTRVFYGLHSLDAPASVDAFKFRLGFRALPVRQVVDFHPLVRPWLGETSLRAAALARRFRPDDSRISKLEGLLRFHVNGHKPLEQQERPAVLVGVPGGTAAGPLRGTRPAYDGSADTAHDPGGRLRKSA
jgi:hypothetical protein